MNPRRRVQGREIMKLQKCPTNALFRRSIETPVKRLRLELEGECRVLSPTANLPNLVRDGGSSSRDELYKN